MHCTQYKTADVLIPNVTTRHGECDPTVTEES